MLTVMNRCVVCLVRGGVVRASMVSGGRWAVLGLEHYVLQDRIESKIFVWCRVCYYLVVTAVVPRSGVLLQASIRPTSKTVLRFLLLLQHINALCFASFSPFVASFTCEM